MELDDSDLVAGRHGEEARSRSVKVVSRRLMVSYGSIGISPIVPQSSVLILVMNED